MVLLVLCLPRWVRDRVLFKRGWRVLWPKKVRLERYPDEASARARAAEVLSEIDGCQRA